MPLILMCLNNILGTYTQTFRLCDSIYIIFNLEYTSINYVSSGLWIAWMDRLKKLAHIYPCNSELLGTPYGTNYKVLTTNFFGPFYMTLVGSKIH